MNSNKISCQKYEMSTFELKFIPYFGVVSQFVSHICYKNINKPLDGAYLADFGLDINKIKRKFHFTKQ